MHNLNLPYATETKARMFCSPDEREKVPYPAPSLALNDLLDDEAQRCIAFAAHRSGLDLKALLSHVVKSWYDVNGDASPASLRRQIHLSKVVRTGEEINAEVAELRKLKKVGAPGEPVGAQLLVLRDRLSHDDAAHLFEEAGADVESAALDACDWLVRREYPDSDINPDEKPSAAWKQRTTEKTAA